MLINSLKNKYVLRINEGEIRIEKLNYTSFNEACYVCYYSSPVGHLEIMANQNAVTSIRRIDNEQNRRAESCKLELGDSLILVKAKEEIEEYFCKKRKYFSFPMELVGTEFQVKVWEALYNIPYGITKSYKDIAIVIDSPMACRAIGNANNKNPISIAVPCHRVVGSDGSLVGYGGGLDMKAKLLSLENVNIYKNA